MHIFIFVYATYFVYTGIYECVYICMYMLIHLYVCMYMGDNCLSMHAYMLVFVCAHGLMCLCICMLFARPPACMAAHATYKRTHC